MSKKLKKNDEYPLPEGCMAIQIKNAIVDCNTKQEFVEYFPKSFENSAVDRFCRQAYGDLMFTLEAKTPNDILFLTGKPTERFPSLNGKNVLIIITDEEE